jgi:hypothetical protein
VPLHRRHRLQWRYQCCGPRGDQPRCAQPAGPRRQVDFSRGIVTFHTGYIFRTDASTQLLATGPFNEPEDGLFPLTGIIETNWLPYPFTMNWQLTRPGSFRFAKGERYTMPMWFTDEMGKAAANIGRVH